MTESVPLTFARGMGPLADMVEARAGARVLDRTFERAGLPLDLRHHPSMLVPLPRLISLFDGAARELGDARFGFDVGSAMTPFSYGKWGAYVCGGRTLAEALQRVVDTLWLHQSRTSMSLVRVGSCTVWRYTSLTWGSRQHSDHVLPPMLMVVRRYLGEDWRPEWIELDYVKPARGDAIDDDVLGTRAVYQSAQLGVAIDGAALDTPLRPVNQPERRVTYTDLLKGRAPSTSVADGAMEAISLRLLDGKSDLEGVARMLDLGPRSLQRQLHSEGTTYRSLLRRARRQRAAALLAETDVPVTEIALSLGYEWPANFTRAFARYESSSPRAYRVKRRHQDAGD